MIIRDLKYAETYSGIKPNDIAAVGIFRRDVDQLRENADMPDEVLGDRGK